MSRRLVTEAKIVLERAGYGVTKKRFSLEVWFGTPSCGAGYMSISGGTVNNFVVIELLKKRGFNEFGYKST